MTQDGPPEDSGAIVVEKTAINAAATKAAITAKASSSSTGTSPDEVDNHKIFTMDDMIDALAKQKLEMETNFAKEMASRAAMHMPSGAAQMPPLVASSSTTTRPTSQTGGCYKMDLSHS